MILYYFKAFHIIGAVAWFAGLFYLVRIFVYHAEVNQKDENLQSAFNAQYELMEQRAYKIICNPAMVITWACGLIMTFLNPDYWLMGWFHVKFFLLILLTGYHFWCGKRIQRLKLSENPFTSFQYRLFNELPTIFLVSIVLLGILKDTLDFIYAFMGVLAFGTSLFVFAKLYKKSRENTKLNSPQSKVESPQ